MIRWWETASPQNYSVMIILLGFVGAGFAIILCGAFANLETPARRALPWAIASIIAPIIVIMSSITVANNHNLYSEAATPNWHDTYGDIYNTCRGEKKGVMECREVAINTANHYHPNQKVEVVNVK